MSTGTDGPPDNAGAIRPRAGAWPQSKLARAQTHYVELQSRVNAWLATEPFELVPEIAEDRLSWRLRLALKQQPPTVEWSNIAGDCIHNLS